MKKSLKLFISLILVLSLLASAATTYFAETIFTSEGYSYTVMDNTYISLYDWDGGSDTLTIPNSLDYLYVREVRNRCFIGRDDFTSLNLNEADYLNRIGLSAFKSTAITGTLSIPPQIRTVASSAFENCDGIEVLYFDSLSELVSAQCFYDCDALREVYLTEGVTIIEPHAFSSCDNLQIIVIPDTVTKISDTAFSEDENLVIYCYTDSAAHQYAVDNGFDYILLDAPEPTEPPTDPPTDAPTEAPTDPATDPATEKTSTVPTEVTFILGDADGDGEISILDATKIQRVLASIDPDDDGMITLRGNVNEEKELNILHATKIQRFIAGYEVAEPIGTEVTRTIQVPVE